MFNTLLSLGGLLGLIALSSGIPTASPNITEEHAQLLSKRTNIGYINFRPNNEIDTTHLTQLNVAWLDSLNLADAAIESLLRRNLRDDIIFNRYFNGNDAAQHANVVDVFRAIAGPNGNGGPGFAHAKFNNVLNNQPVPPGNGVIPTLCLDPAFPTIGAGAWNPNVLAYITVCGRGYTKLSASEVRARLNPCARTEIFPEMLYLGSIALHEYTHADPIGTAAINNLQILDFTPGPGAPFWGARIPTDPPTGYGLVNAMQLRVSRPAQVYRNADNYMWFALDAYWTRMCGHDFEPAVEDCPPEGCIIG